MKLSHGTNRYFFVTQKDSMFLEENRGGFLWSPQYKKGGAKHPGYETMKEVKKGDMVFHCSQSVIFAVSRAKTSCYAARNPGGAFIGYDATGWRIDVDVFYFKEILYLSQSTKIEMYKIQGPNGPFHHNGYGKEQYLCDASIPLANFILEKIYNLQKNKDEWDNIKAFIGIKETLELEIDEIKDGCIVEALLLPNNIKTRLEINVKTKPHQIHWIGKKSGDILKVGNLSYRVEKIYHVEKW